MVIYVPIATKEGIPFGAFSTQEAAADAVRRCAKHFDAEVYRFELDKPRHLPEDEEEEG